MYYQRDEFSILIRFSSLSELRNWTTNAKLFWPSIILMSHWDSAETRMYFLKTLVLDVSAYKWLIYEDLVVHRGRKFKFGSSGLFSKSERSFALSP